MDQNLVMKQEEGKNRHIQAVQALPKPSPPGQPVTHQVRSRRVCCHTHTRSRPLSISPALRSLRELLHATDILQNWYLHVFKHIYYLNWFA